MKKPSLYDTKSKCASNPAPVLELATKLQIQDIRHSLRHLPDSPYRQLIAWLLEHEHYRQQWFQLTGMQQVIHLTFQLLDGLVSPTDWRPLLRHYGALINTYQLYEIVSDNLAIGLATLCHLDRQQATQRRLLQTFNEVMVAKLQGATQCSTPVLLKPLQPQLDRISAFTQSLSTEKHRGITSAFLQAHPEIHLDDLEYSLYPSLVANVEIAIDLVQAIDHCASYPLVRDTLIWRYAGMNCLLETPNLPLDTLLEISRDTILVIPTLAYYSAVLAEEIHHIPHYPTLLADQSLLEVFKDAALVVRLLNDLGTQLLEQTDAERTALIQTLRLAQTQHRFTTWRALLLHASEAYGALFTRLRKDLLFGEFNVCLAQLNPLEEIDETLATLHDTLATLATIYRERLQRLHQQLPIVSQRLQNSISATLIWRFVKFHQTLYSHDFNEPLGEYAI